MPRYEDEGYEPPRRNRPNDRGQDGRASSSQRESLMQRRLRRARGEDVDDYDDADYDDDDYEPRGYGRATGAYAPRYAGPTGCAGTTLYIVLGFLAVFVILLLLIPRFISGLVPNVDVPEQIRQVVATPTTTVLDRGGTILQIRNLSRLETRSYSAERIIEVSVERGNILDAVTGDRLLLLARGTTVAGVDLSKLREEDVTISPDGKSITIRLPPSEVFSSELDTDNTQVYDRQTGILAPENMNLETEARQRAVQEIFDAACESGIMQQSAEEAQRSLERFLELLDFEQITVVPNAGQCVRPPTVPTAPTVTP